MFCNDCLTAAKTKTGTENKVRERNKTQAKMLDNTACLSLWVGFGAARTEVSKILHGFLAAVFLEKARCWGWLHEEGSHESAEGCTPTFSAEGCTPTFPAEGGH